MPGVGGLDVGDAKLGDRAAAVSDTVQTRIVERHQDAVASDVRIGLEIAIAERDGSRERRQRVLRGLVRPTAMREGKRSSPAKERVTRPPGHRSMIACPGAARQPATCPSGSSAR